MKQERIENKRTASEIVIAIGVIALIAAAILALVLIAGVLEEEKESIGYYDKIMAA